MTAPKIVTCHDCGKTVTDYISTVQKSKKVYRCIKCGGMEPNYDAECICCGQSPVLPLTDMCSHCTFGEDD